MNIDEMNDGEKSVMLAKAMGWHVANVPRGVSWYNLYIVDSDGTDVGLRPLGGGIKKGELPMRLNLYYPANMALAKRTIQWGVENVPGFDGTLYLIAYAAWTKDDGVRTLLDELVIGAELITQEEALGPATSLST